jgi:uncharacterized protein involved in outer membrane biogenesis
MKKAHKILRVVLLVIVVLVVSVVALIHLFGNSALKAGIETAASKTLSVRVSIDDMDFSILGGKVSFQNLVIDNPPGYQHDKLLEVGNARIAVSIGSLLKDTVIIKEIMFDGVNVVIEQKGLSNNLQDIIKALPKSEAEPEDATETPAKKLHIDNLEITNVTVKAKLLPVPGKADTVTLKLNPIRMTDLGSDEKMDVAKLSSKILLAIATGVAEQGAGKLPKGMTDGMKATLSKATELGKTAAEEGKKLLEEGKDTGKEIIEGFKGLLKPKK